MSVRISVTEEQVERAKAMLSSSPAMINNIICEAINKSIAIANRETTRKLQAEYTVKKSIITKSKKVKKRAGKKNLVAVIESKGKPLTVRTAFIVRPSRKSGIRRQPVYVRVKKMGGGVIQNAFLTTVETGHIGVKHLGVFIRNNKWGRNGNKKRERIKAIYGPSVPQMIGNEDIVEYIENLTEEKLDFYIEEKVSAFLERR